MKPEDSIGYLIRRTGRGMRNMIQAKLKEAELDITMEQGAILIRLGINDGCSQNELSEFLGKDKTTLTRLIDNMEDKSLLVRVSSESDKRVKLLYSSKKGKECRLKVIQVLQSGLQEATQGIPKEDLKTTKETLNKIFANVTA